MQAKIIVILLLLCCVTTAWSQQYFLPSVKDWPEETMHFPIDFAPHIPYVGDEVLRFTPDWGDINSQELWSYCFLWMINGDAKVDEVTLNKDLKEYYSGLIGRNIMKRKIDSLKIIPTIVLIKSDLKNKNVYTGTISMLDYMNQQPVLLHVTVQIKDCIEEKKKAVFISISPQPNTHPIWKNFADIWQGFICKS